MNGGATYRFQLNDAFGFADVAKRATYLSKLGITHVYLSPCFQARSGSAHGYDVVDPRRLNIELGGEPEFFKMSNALQNVGIRVILDIVPNHMATSAENPYWWNMLKGGPNAEHADWFDVHWKTSSRGHQYVFLPVLGGSLKQVVESEEVTLVESSCGEICARYYDKSFPIKQQNEARAILAAADSSQRRGDTYRLLLHQHYRLTQWQRAGYEISYRRFFDINELVGLRMHDARVFHSYHELLLRLVKENMVHGVRVDHVDGLRDPEQYLQQLAQALGKPGAASTPILVEKILCDNEQLPESWPVAGTTGYEFIQSAETLIHAPDGLRGILDRYRKRSRTLADFHSLTKKTKKQVLNHSLRPDLRRLLNVAATLLERPAHDSGPALRRVLIELLSSFPVYRTYISERGISASDQSLLRALFSELFSHTQLDQNVVHAIHAGFGLAEAELTSNEFIARFQQLSAPTMAKGVEDTALYQHVALVSRNEVGVEPCYDGNAHAEQVHADFARRAEDAPASMLALSTHDTKRSADVRARLAVLSEIPTDWFAIVAKLERTSRPFRTAARQRQLPGWNTRYLFYQTAVGIWPLDHNLERHQICNRIVDYTRKALREGKRNSSWVKPDEIYESATERFIRTCLESADGEAFRELLQSFSGRITEAGLWKSLVIRTLQLTSPGTPDIYQGDETWNFTLVDPDNRRPVDYRHLEEQQSEIPWDNSAPAQLQALAENPRHPLLKQTLIQHWLQLRVAQSELFAKSDYIPCATDENMFAFIRQTGKKALLVVIPRYFYKNLAVQDSRSIAEKVWGNSHLTLSNEFATRDWRNVFNGTAAKIEGSRLLLAPASTPLPIGVFTTS